MFKNLTSRHFDRLRALGLAFITVGLTSAFGQAGIVNADTSQAAPAGRYIISGKAGSLYYRGWNGGKSKIVSLMEPVAPSMYYPGYFPKFNSSSLEYSVLYQDNTGNVGVRTTSPATALDVAGIISTTGGFRSNPGGASYNYLLNSTSTSPALYLQNANASGDVFHALNGSAGIGSGTSRLIIKGSGFVGINKSAPAEMLDVSGNIRYSGTVKPGGVAPVAGQFLKATSTTANAWANIGISDITNGNKIVTADTASGRAVLQIPGYVAALIPDSSHLAIEADYLKARSSGNSYFDTLRVGWDYYNLLKDSIELVLPDFDTLLSDHEFHVTFFGWDSDSSFYHNHDSSFYKAVVNNSGVKVDSVLTYTVNSILYFSDTIYYVSQSSGKIYASNYMASNHPRLPFRIPSENTALISFTLFYNSSNHKYYIR